MLKEIGRFKVDSSGVIHLKNEADEREFFAELDCLPKKAYRELPEVKYDYNRKKGAM
ncbi:MAG: hypothetical protein IJF92_00120 [Bacilli bacterium]|nr:hypothetical protein [Bacilli bacterium]MBQ3307605.1 hypothetical protein [Bacilli bacterium]MBQ3423451.1 hypothetical protein [Romboutsia sp.]